VLSIALLGSPQILRDGDPLKVPRRKSRALLYYIAAQEGSVSREQIMAFFWPDEERAAAQQVLRTSLYGLRQAFGESLLISEDAIGISAGTWVDVHDFEAALTAAHADMASLVAALSLYRGEFLAGFFLPDTVAFDNWLAVEREHYRRLAVRGFTTLASLQEANGEYLAALDTIDRALLFDPLREDLQQDALRLHYLAGDRAGAIRRYEQLRRALDEELGVPPMLATRDLYQAIISDRPAAPGRLPPPAGRRTAQAPDGLSTGLELPFTGRSAEIHRLFALAGARKLVLLEGEPGIGKTRVAEEFIRRFDALPLAGAGRELEQSLPYQPVVEALRGLLARPDWPALFAAIRVNVLAVWLAEASRLLPELSGTPAALQPAPKAEDEPRLWEGVSQLLTALSRQRRVLVFLDDLHWADTSTLSMLNYLLRQMPGEAIYFLAAARPALARSPFAAFLHALTREDRLARIRLDRLNELDITELSRQLNPEQANSLARWLGSLSEGNPYVLVELIRDARQKEILRPDYSLAPGALADSPLVPQTVYTLIEARLAGLSEPARRVLDTAVAIGRDFEFELVARAAAQSESAALDALDELRRAGLIHPLEGLQYRFGHSLTMEVAYREVGEPRHRLIHRRVAEAMESLYSRPKREAAAGLIASHYDEGNASKQAAPYALRAAQQAMQLRGWKEAIGFYEMALRGTPADRQGEVYAGLGEAYFLDNNFHHAVEAYQRAIELAEKGRDMQAADQARLALGEVLLVQARFDEAITLARQIQESGNPERSMKAEILWGTALSLEGADLASAADHLQRAASACPVENFPLELSHIKFELGSIAAQQGDLEQAVSLYQEALAAAQQVPTELSYSAQILAYNNLAYHLLLLGDSRGTDYAETGMALARERGALGLLSYLLSTSGEIALERGDLSAAEQFFTEGLALAERLRIPERVAGLTANLGLIAIQAGQRETAIHRLSVALAEADALGTWHLGAQIRIWLAPLLPLEEARARLGEARSMAESSGRRRLLAEIRRLEKQILPA
jgi:DNA-binding SARP family transcriptional activator